jgi:hypothetical protein
LDTIYIHFMAWETQTKRTWYLVLKNIIVCDAVVGGQRQRSYRKCFNYRTNPTYRDGVL